MDDHLANPLWFTLKRVESTLQRMFKIPQHNYLLGKDVTGSMGGRHEFFDLLKPAPNELQATLGCVKCGMLCRHVSSYEALLAITTRMLIQSTNLEQQHVIVDC